MDISAYLGVSFYSYIIHDIETHILFLGIQLVILNIFSDMLNFIIFFYKQKIGDMSIIRVDLICWLFLNVQSLGQIWRINIFLSLN